MTMSSIKTNVNQSLAIVISLVATLIVSTIAAAASIREEVRLSVITAAGFLEIWFLLWIVDQF